MKAITPYLNFDGNTREAMTFYADALGGKLEMQTFADSGMDQDPKNANRIMHAKLESGNGVLMASDTMPDHPFQQGTNVHVCVDCSTGELDRFYAKLAQGGKAVMEPQDTFWGARFGMLVDKFGIQWMFNAEKPTS